MGYERWVESEVVRQAAPRTATGAYFLPLLVLLLGAGAIARFAGLGSRSLWLDEGYSAWFSALSWIDLWTLTPKYETHPPFFYSILKIWTQGFGDSAAALRSLPAVAGVLAIPVMAAAAREAGKLTGVSRPAPLILVTCAFLALSPRLIIAAQDARPYALLLLAYAVALTAWLRLTRSFRAEPNSPGRIGDWAMLGLATSFVLWLHALGVLYGCALFLALLATSWNGANRARWFRLVGTGTVCAILYAPCLLMMAGRSGDWSNGWLRWEPSLFPAQLMNLYGNFEIDEPVSALVSTLAICGLLVIGLRALWSA